MFYTLAFQNIYFDISVDINMFFTFVVGIVE